MCVVDDSQFGATVAGFDAPTRTPRRGEFVAPDGAKREVASAPAHGRGSQSADPAIDEVSRSGAHVRHGTIDDERPIKAKGTYTLPEEWSAAAAASDDEGDSDGYSMDDFETDESEDESDAADPLVAASIARRAHQDLAAMREEATRQTALARAATPEVASQQKYPVGGAAEAGPMSMRDSLIATGKAELAEKHGMVFKDVYEAVKSRVEFQTKANIWKEIAADMGGDPEMGELFTAVYDLCMFELGMVR